MGIMHRAGGALSDLEVVLVSGGARRIGAAIVRTLHEAGMRIAVHCHRSRAEAEALCEELNALRHGSARALPADLARPESPVELVEATVGTFGRLDAVVNNAAVFSPGPLGEIEPAALDALFAVNTFAPLLISQAAAPHLQAWGGSIINIGDIYATGLSRPTLRTARRRPRCSASPAPSRRRSRPGYG